MVRRYFISLVLAALAASSLATGLTERQSGSGEPCGKISSLLDSQLFVPADIALQCLQSVPLDKAGDTKQVAGLKSLVQFQSDLSYLKSPPPGYLYPAVDILGGLDKISDKLQSNFYKNEYDFQLDLFKLVVSAYDGHFSYVPDIVSVFVWLRLNSQHLIQGTTPDTFSIFSVSTDGTSLPSIYGFVDQPALAGQTSGYKPSAITKINGEDVETYLNKYAATSGTLNQQDPDANYNFLFPNMADNSSPPLTGSYGNQFSQALTYQGTDTILTFTNGTTRHIAIMGAVASTNRAKFRNVKDGQSFFQAFCTNNILKELQGSVSSSAPYSSLIPSATSVPAVSISSQVPYKPIPTTEKKGFSSAYPDPFVIASDGSIAGYFSDSQSDLAILAIPNYAPRDPVEFEDVTRQFLATAKAHNRKKLIIDLRGNPGGISLMASDTAHQLFPSIPPYGAGNYRASDLFDFTGKAISSYFAGTTPENANAQDLNKGFSTLGFNYREMVDENNQDFTSWDDFYGPNAIHGGLYTSLSRTNLSDPFQTVGIDVYGYGEDDQPQPQTFDSDNVVMLHDGACASTCSIFAEFVKNQAHVRSIVVGGRSQSGPMQAVGGIKGSSFQGMVTVFEIVESAYYYGTPQQKAYFTKNYGTSWASSVEKALSRAAPGGEVGVLASINYRNNIRKGDSSNTPLQYVYEAADSRFFYTASMYTNQEQVWDKAYNIAFNGGASVKGSTGQKSSSFGTGYITDSAPSGVSADDSIFPSAALGNASPNQSSGVGTGSSSKGSGSTKKGAAGRFTVSVAGVVGAFVMIILMI